MKEGNILVQIAVCCVILSLKCLTTQGQCSGPLYLNAYSSTEHFIQSPGYPSDYPKSSYCRWRLTAPMGYHVQLTFLEFKTHSGLHLGACYVFISDILEVYDSSYGSSSKRLGRYCGSDLPATVGSSSRYLYIRFRTYHTSSVASNYRFKMKYKAVKAPSQDDSTCSPFFLSSINSNIKASSSLYTSKYIESPLYPNKYPSKIKCVWYITASTSANKIQLTLSEMKIYSDLPSYCSSTGSDDVLTLRDGKTTNNSVLKTICGPQSSPQTITSSGRSMTIIFTSNEENYKNGSTTRFKLQYREIDPEAGGSLCSPSNSNYTNNNIRLESSPYTKYIKSPWYPYNYPRNIQCTWYITASSSSKRIVLILSDVKIYNEVKYFYSCHFNSDKVDMLTITDGSSTKSQNLKSVCSSVSSSTVRSTGRYMTIKFKTNSDDYFVTNNAGFKLKYYETEIKHYEATTEPKPESASNVGMIVGIVFGVIFGLGLLLVCCVWVRKRQSNAGNVQRVPAAATTHLTTMTASHAPIAPGAPQYPMQIPGGPPAQGSFVVPAGSYPPPGQSSYPSDKGSYPPPQGTFALPGHSHPLPIQGTYSPPGGYSPYTQVSYIPPVNGPVSGDPPPQYPGINADSSQAPPAFNPQFQGPP